MSNETAKSRTAVNKASGKYIIRLTITAVFMALNISLSSFGVPVPGGHLYLCDMAIVLAALLLNPFEAFAVGGIGSFLGDLIFYPLPMFVTLFTHGLQAVAISLISHKVLKKKPVLSSIIAVSVGVVIMVTGYTLGKIFVYSTVHYAIVSFPYEVAQGTLGAVLGTILAWKAGVRNAYKKIISDAE